MIVLHFYDSAMNFHPNQFQPCNYFDVFTFTFTTNGEIWAVEGGGEDATGNSVYCSSKPAFAPLGDTINVGCTIGEANKFFDVTLV